MITSKIISKAHTTIPRAIRAALNLGKGDEIVYLVEDGRVILAKAAPGPIDAPFATFGEGDGAADRRAYAEL